jgi:GT2 family glycosyltransferase
VKVLVIMVLYKTQLSESPTFQGLIGAFSTHPDLAQSYELMVWDNSPDPIANGRLPIPILYRHSNENLGVSGAYNYALDHAIDSGIEWILLLDQDTKITSDFLIAMLTRVQELDSNQTIAAIVPTVRTGRLVVSPSFRALGKTRPYPQGESGIAFGEASAINSGCVLRAASLRTVGGYSPDFWLDYSDVYVFHQFFLHGMRVWRAADVEIEHDLSLMDYGRLMSPGRSQNFTGAESAFSDLYNGRLERAALTFRLLARAIKHRIKFGNQGYASIAWKQFVYRLMVSRTKRIERWVSGRKDWTDRKTNGIGRPVSR